MQILTHADRWQQPSETITEVAEPSTYFSKRLRLGVQPGRDGEIVFTQAVHFSSSKEKNDAARLPLKYIILKKTNTHGEIPILFTFWFVPIQTQVAILTILHMSPLVGSASSIRTE